MKKRFLLFLLVLGLLGATAPLKTKMKEVRGDSGESPLQAMEPGVFMGTLLMGPFRSLAVNYLWVKADKMRLQGKFFQEKALLELISRLQPYLPEIWIANGYNQVYNISLSFRDKERQWEWIQSGMKFLKKGVDLNPQNSDLRFDLAYYAYHRLRYKPNQRVERDPGKLTYFQEQFMKDKELNPEGLHPHAFAVYWAEQSVEVARKEEGEDNTLASNLVLVALRQLVLWRQAHGKNDEVAALVKRAMAHERRLAEVNPQYYPFARYLLCWFQVQLARVHISEKQWKKAAEALKKARNINPSSRLVRRWWKVVEGKL